MISFFKPRLLCVYAVSVFLVACASNNTSPSKPTTTKPSVSLSHSNDIWQRVRNSYALPDLYNAEVTGKENYYAQRADYVGRMATRSGDFMYLIMNEVEKRNMPSEIALLPFVESAFVTTAQSPVKAAGLWQFMPATGRDFSLQQNHFVDQRNDVVASTDAALTFLQRLYNQFGDWQLALAAYNWGPGNVSKAVRKAKANGLAGTYSDIKMPLETRQYVPKLQAMKNIVGNPSLYGITLPTIGNNTRHEVVNVTRDMDISTAARLSGLDEESFKRINPSFKKSIIVASLGTKILVPSERADDVRRALRDSSQNLASVTTYSTYNTESLDDIANKFNTNADNLRYLNNIPQFHGYVKAGSALLVPRTSSRNSQDIPFEALTAGLSTTSGGVGLGNGEFIEQPTIVVNNSDETTRQERSGIITTFQPSNNSGLGLNVSADNYSRDDDLGALIKNNNNTLNDPLPASNAVIVRAPTAPAEPAFVAPIYTPQPAIVNNIEPIINTPSPITAPTPTIVAAAPTPLTVINPVAPAAPTSLTVFNPVATAVPAAPAIIVPPVAVAATDPVLTPFVATVVDTPEVIEEPVQVVSKPVVVRARPVKPSVKVAEVKKPIAKTTIVKVNSTKGKAQLIPVEVKRKTQKVTAPTPAKVTTKTTSKTPVPQKPTVIKTSAKKPVEKPVEKPKTKVVNTTSNKKPVPPAKPNTVAVKKPVAKTVDKVVKKSNDKVVTAVRKKTLNK